MDQMKSFRSRPDVTNLIYMTQHYLNKTLSMNDLNNLLFIHDTLDFPIDLIEYLVEYCANMNKASIKYITSVAIAWSQQNIKTVRDARAKIESSAYAKECSEVLKALGIDRSPTKADLTYVRKWLDEYKMSMDVIMEACARTVAYASSVSLKYADCILTRWHEKGADTIDKVRSLDDEHEQSKKKSTRSARSTSNKFNNFSGRDTDYNDLAQAIMNSQDKI
jgi:DnaD/phage-associated family protein